MSTDARSQATVTVQVDQLLVEIMTSLQHNLVLRDVLTEAKETVKNRLIKTAAAYSLLGNP